MTDRAAIIEAMETAFDVLGAPSPADVIHARKTLRAAIVDLAAVAPAPPSIPEREKVLEALKASQRVVRYGGRDNRNVAEPLIESAIAALEGK